MRPLKEKVSITLDNDIVKKIKEMAEYDDRSFSQFINKVLKEYINQQENEQK
ncbi:MAG: ribbon-helix-helix domain-containing protein [Clostridia bacterium]|nr:ribbon-helix-helix domain-containing protein [Clostridia bacterium]